MTRVRQYLIVVLTWISLIISNSSIFSCAYWPSACLFWRDTYFLLPHYSVGFFYCYWVMWAVWLFLKLSFCWSHCLQMFSFNPYLIYFCLFVYYLLCYAKAYKFDFPWEANLRKYIGIIYVRDCFPYFLFRSFMILCLILVFKPFWVYLCVCVVRVCSNFTDLHVTVQFSQHHLLKWLPSWKINWPYVYGFISRLPILLHWSCSFLCQYLTILITITL